MARKSQVKVPSFNTTDYTRIKDAGGKATSRYRYKNTETTISKDAYNKQILQPERSLAQYASQKVSGLTERMGITRKQIARETGIKENLLNKYFSGEKFKGFTTTDAEKIKSYFDNRPIRLSEGASLAGVSTSDFPSKYKGKPVDLSRMRYVDGLGLTIQHGSQLLYPTKITNKITGKSTVRFYSIRGLQGLGVTDGTADSEYEDLLDAVDFEIAA